MDILHDICWQSEVRCAIAKEQFLVKECQALKEKNTTVCVDKTHANNQVQAATMSETSLPF